MSGDFPSIVTGGGSGLVVALLAYLGKLWLDSRGQRTVESSARVSDRQTENAILLSTLQSLQGENHRLASRVRELENSLGDRDRKIQALEERVGDLTLQLADVGEQLSHLRGPPGR